MNFVDFSEAGDKNEKNGNDWAYLSMWSNSAEVRNVCILGLDFSSVGRMLTMHETLDSIPTSA